MAFFKESMYKLCNAAKIGADEFETQTDISLPKIFWIFSNFLVYLFGLLQI